jgi:DNA primase
VPLVARIKDVSLRDEYARQLAGWTGWEDVPTVLRRVRETAERASGGAGGAGGASRGGPYGASTSGQQRRPRPSIVDEDVQPTLDGPGRPRPDDPRLWPQREALKVALQAPALAGPMYETIQAGAFTEPAYLALHRAIIAAGGTTAGLAGAAFLEAVAVHCPPGTVRTLLTELTVEPLEVRSADEARYASAVLARLQETVVLREIAQVKSKLQRLSPVDDSVAYHQLFGDLVALEQYRKGLGEQALGALA